MSAQRTSNRLLRLVLGCALALGVSPISPTAFAAPAPPSAGLAFSAPLPITTHADAVPSTTSRGVAAEDVDNDGDTDLVTTHPSEGGTEAFYAVARRHDDGGYSATTTYTAGVAELAGDLAAGDIDGDGDVDFASGSGAGHFTLATNDGSGGLAVRSYDYPYATVGDLAFGDFDRDGDLDLLVAGGVIGNITLFFNDGTGDFPTSQAFVGGDGPAHIEVADFTGDGWLDAFVAEDAHPGRFLVYIGSEGWLERMMMTTDRPAARANGAAFGDVDSDGDLDLLVADDFDGTDAGPVLYRNDNGELVWQGAAAPDAWGSADGADIELADADRDGDLDLLTTNGGVRFWPNDGTGTFGTPSASPGGSAGQMRVCDVDLDGLPDVVAVDGEGVGLEIYANESVRGAARSQALLFGSQALSGLGDHPVAVEAGDFNGDGRVDVACLAQGNSSVQVRFGHGGEGFDAAISTDVDPGGTGAPSELAKGDFDGDGLLDLAVLSHASGRVTAWLQAGGPVGAGSFISGGSVDVPGPRRASVMDYDHDGDEDIAVVADAGAYVLTNDGTGAFGLGDALSLGSAEATGIGVAAWPLAPEGANTRAARAFAASAYVGGEGRMRQFADAGGAGWASAAETSAVVGPLVAGDFERDGRPDLAGAGGTAAGRPLSVLRAPVGGPMASVPGTVTVPAADVAAADLNGDGCPDLVVGGSPGADFRLGELAPGSSSAAGVVQVLLGNGRGGEELAFANDATLTAGPGTRDVEVADFNADGMLDILTADLGTAGDAGQVTLFLQRVDAQAPEVTSDAVPSYDLFASISVVASDGAQGSGVSRLFTQLDAAAPVETQSATATVVTTAPGAHTLSYWAEDAAGNQSEHATANFTIRRPSAFTLSTGSGTVKYLTAFPIAGTLTGPAALPGATVTLQKWTGTDWADVVSMPTGSSGQFAFSPRIETKTTYRVVFGGDALHTPIASSSISKLPYASLGTPVTPTGIRRGAYFTCYGSLKPRHASGSTVVRLYRQQYVRGRWVSRGYVNAKASNYSSYSKYSARMRLEFIGKWRVRAYHSDGTHAATYSAWRTVYAR